MPGRAGLIAAARAWLEAGHLQKFIIEFYRPGTTRHASARWDFPIRYDGNGVDQLWVDRHFLKALLAKVDTTTSQLHLPRCCLRLAPPI